MGRLGLSGMGKLPGHMGDCEVILCEVPQPGVQLTVDGCVMVMKRDEMNLILNGGKCLSFSHSLSLSHIHTQTQYCKEWPYRLCAEMLACDKHHLVRCYFCSVSTFKCFRSDTVKLTGMEFIDIQYERNVLTQYITSS